MMEFDTVQSLQNLSHAVSGCHDSVLSRKVEEHDDYQPVCAHITARVHASPQTEWGSGLLAVNVPLEVVGNQAVTNTP